MLISRLLRFLVPVGAGVLLSAMVVSSAKADSIIIHRRSRGSSSFIYGSPISTPVPVDPVTGRPTRLSRPSPSGYLIPSHEYFDRRRSRRRGSVIVIEDPETVIINGGLRDRRRVIVNPGFHNRRRVIVNPSFHNRRTIRFNNQGQPYFSQPGRTVIRRDCAPRDHVCQSL